MPEPINPLRFCVTGETAEIVDRLLGDFLLSCLGKNDMSVVSGMLTSAAILVATHCQRTGEDFEELAGMTRRQFELGLKVASERLIRPPKEKT